MNSVTLQDLSSIPCFDSKDLNVYLLISSIKKFLTAC
jgi:hypothetical protein